MKNNKPADRLFKQPTSMAIAIGGAAFAAFATSAALSLPAMAANGGNGSEVKGFATNTWNFIQSFVSESTFKNNQVVGRPMAAQSNALGNAAALELRTQAAAQLQQRDFIGADKTLRRALSLAPEGVSTQAMLAVAIDGQGRRTEARRMLDAMVGTGAAESASNVRLEELAPVAAAYTSVGDPRRALQIYNQMIAANFETAELHSGRGDAMQMLGDDLAALASYQLAAEVEPRFPSLELKRAASLEKLGRVSEAENAYRVAMQLDPSSGVARGNLARLEAGRPAMASMVVEASAPKASSAAAPAAATPAAPTTTPTPATTAKIGRAHV